MATPTLLPLPEAAARLGLSQSALRRRLRNGSARGARRPTSSGFMWWVDVEADVDAPAAHGVRTPIPERQAGRARTPTADAPQERPGGPLASQRAEEMARYSRELLAPYVVKIEQQATALGRLEERTGHLEAENAELRARVAELESPETRSAPPEGSARRSSWWLRLSGWFSGA